MSLYPHSTPVDPTIVTARRPREGRKKRTEPSVEDPMHAHPDTGCDVAPRCLACPLPMCRYDDPAWFHGHRRMIRDLRIVDLYKVMKNRVQVAERMGLSPRTVDRALAKVRRGKYPMEGAA